MNVALWIVAVVLALGMGVSGFLKVVFGREKLTSNPRMAWAQDLTDPMFRTIGSLEFLGALGVILPALTGIRAAPLVPPLVFTLLAIFVAWGRFGACSFQATKNRKS